MLLTKDNNKSTLNVAFAYTSRDEITNSIATIVKGVEENDLETEDLNHSLINECLFTNKCRDVDLLVRTSGEMRFSDFLLWQVRRVFPHCETITYEFFLQTPATVFYFTKALWPEFSLWHLLAAVFFYQRSFYKSMLVKSHLRDQATSLLNSERVDKFLAKVEKNRYEELLKMQSS